MIQTGGDVDCLDLKKSNTDFIQKCTLNRPLQNEEVKCYTEFVADWLPRGVMEYTLKRGCKYVKKDIPKKECHRQGSTGLFYYRDCHVIYDGNNENADDKQELYELMAVKLPNGNLRPPNTCRSCCTRTHPDTALQCMNDPINLPNGEIECPIYANAGCFNANMHKIGILNPDEQEYAKGCTPFLFEDDSTGDPIYDPQCIIEGTQEVCKQTCDGDHCNVGLVGEQLQCYTCTVTVDSALNPIGWGDVECVESALDRQLETCGPDQNVCVAEMEIDWRPSGLQTVTVRRGCGSSAQMEQPPNSIVCDGIGSSAFRRRICTKSCDGTKCNQDLEGLEEQFAENNVKSCRACQSKEIIEDDDHVLHDCAEDELTSITCPNFLTSACYSSRSTERRGTASSLASHGCSAFKQELQMCTRFDTTGTIDDDGIHGDGEDNTSLRVCKETCASDDCNDKVVDSNERNNNKCYECQQRFNSRGEPIGFGNTGCFNPENESEVDEKYLMRCEAGKDYCSIDVEVDWTIAGQQQMTITRSCSNSKPSGDAMLYCHSDNLQNGFQFIDCTQSWAGLAGVGTNKDASEVMKRIGGDNVESCHTCEESPPAWPTLGACETPGDDTKRSCPSWAKQGCFKSVSEHQENGHKMTETIRGCSTFTSVDYEQKERHEEEHAVKCNGFRIDDTQFEVCKQACTEDNCNHHANNEEVFPRPLECFICEQTKNHLGQTVGFSDEGCFDAPDESYLHVCGPQATMCSTLMEVDWLATGEQITLVRRGCGVKNAPSTVCTEETLSNFQYKQCVEFSVGAGSNYNFEIAQEFAHPFAQERCYSCSHNSKDGPDNNNCFADDHEHHQDESRARRCPIYANAGCFTADNIHQENGLLMTEVHRGCSTFEAETVACAHMEYTDGYDYATCRQTCHNRGNWACNSEKYPEEENECECP